MENVIKFFVKIGLFPVTITLFILLYIWFIVSPINNFKFKMEV